MKQLSLNEQLNLIAKSSSGPDILLKELSSRFLRQHANQYEPVRELSFILYRSGRLVWAEQILQLCHQLNPLDLSILYCLADIYQHSFRQLEATYLYSNLPVTSNSLMSLAYHPYKQASDTRKLVRDLVSKSSSGSNLSPKTIPNILRIGFVSGDLCQHPVGLFLIPLVEEWYTYSAIEVYFYDNCPKHEWASEALQKCGQWRDISDISDQQAYKLIQDDSISVLIDLSGHTARNRLPLFCLRPCNVQISWLGYWSTTGLYDTFDAVFVDQDVVVPASPQEQSFVEPLKYFSPVRWCYRAVPWMPEIQLPPCLKNNYITFGCFNSSLKINSELLNAWSKILSSINDSKLFIKNYQLKDSQLCDYLYRYFINEGITKERIILQGPSVHAELLERYHEIDIALDTFPFNGGLTSCEALWMGLPLVTRCSFNHSSVMASRQGFSLLNTLGRPEWIASSSDEYINIACGLASNINNLSDIRINQRSAMASSQICNSKEFARNFLIALREVFKYVHNN